jgi:hypothetical protein
MRTRPFPTIISLIVLLTFLTGQIAGAQDREIPQRKDLPYGIGAQYAAPAFGVSGIYDFTNSVSGQAVLGFFGGLQSYSGRVLYRFNRKKAYDLYGYGTLGIWRYSGFGETASATGIGGGVGIEYSWQHLFDSPDIPPLFGNIELGFVNLTGEFNNYTFSSFVYGAGIHYRFGN